MSKIEYSQGVCCDGAAILQDGVMMTVDHVVGTLNALTAELEQLRQERDGLRADAARYRWLRSNNVGPSQIEKVSDDCNPPYFTLKCEGELDAAIDAAMAKEQGDE